MKEKRVIECEHCGRVYSEEEYEKLELRGHNIIWNFDYRRCKECGKEITPLELCVIGRIKTE